MVRGIFLFPFVYVLFHVVYSKEEERRGNRIESNINIKRNKTICFLNCVVSVAQHNIFTSIFCTICFLWFRLQLFNSKQLKLKYSAGLHSCFTITFPLYHYIIQIAKLNFKSSFSLKKTKKKQFFP